jgi:hypothetical protein
MFNDFMALLSALVKEKIEISERAGEPIIQTTKRTEIKNRIENAFLKGLAELMDESDVPFIVGMTSEGIVLAIEHNDLIAKGGEVVGEIPFQFEIKVKNLNYETENEIEIFTEEQANKEEEKRQAEIAKQAKIKNDGEVRAEKKRLKELGEAMKKLKATE